LIIAGVVTLAAVWMITPRAIGVMTLEAARVVTLETVGVLILEVYGVLTLKLIGEPTLTNNNWENKCMSDRRDDYFNDGQNNWSSDPDEEPPRHPQGF